MAVFEESANASVRLPWLIGGSSVQPTGTRAWSDAASGAGHAKRAVPSPPPPKVPDRPALGNGSAMPADGSAPNWTPESLGGVIEPESEAERNVYIAISLAPLGLLSNVPKLLGAAATRVVVPAATATARAAGSAARAVGSAARGAGPLLRSGVSRGKDLAWK